jgi:hypothetical protein
LLFSNGLSKKNLERTDGASNILEVMSAIQHLGNCSHVKSLHWIYVKSQ